jgi:AmmeMemoRadiSam system protein A
MMDPSQPLADAVADAAIASATRDHRFDPILPDELPRLSVDITVLEPREPITGPADVIIGRHGLYIEHSGARGILLPQVAEERGWDAEQFLEALCRKAGLRFGAWRDGAARLYRFGGVKFVCSPRAGTAQSPATHS